MFNKNTEDRFVKVYKQGKLSGIEVYVDRETGVNYAWTTSGYGMGFTPLLDKDGKPLVTDPKDLDRYEY